LFHEFNLFFAYRNFAAQLDLDLPSIGADYYVGNCHKWFSAPKGTAFLYTSAERRAATHPLVISHGLGSGFSSEFMWTGLSDFGPFLALPAVLATWNRLGGLDAVRAYTHALCRSAAALLVAKYVAGLCFFVCYDSSYSLRTDGARIR
jgi:isopenicillin-N epimerase